MAKFTAAQLDAIARAAGQDTANRNAKANGRAAWNDEDYDVAVQTFNRLRPIDSMPENRK